jgi:hypothetical protein
MALNIAARKSLQNQLPRLLQSEARRIVQKEFQKIKNKMMAEFLAHPVTREIEGGINAQNISQTLNGITNLYSFIGFESGDKPIEDLEDILLSTDIRFTKVTKTGVEFEVTLPEPKEIFAQTPLPWATGRSWVKGIESGLSGLGYYLKKKSDNSRSGLGIQSSKRTRNSVKFRNTKYISALLNKYKKEFENIKL